MIQYHRERNEHINALSMHFDNHHLASSDLCGTVVYVEQQNNVYNHCRFGKSPVKYQRMKQQNRELKQAFNRVTSLIGTDKSTPHTNAEIEAIISNVNTMHHNTSSDSYDEQDHDNDEEEYNYAHSFVRNTDNQRHSYTPASRRITGRVSELSNHSGEGNCHTMAITPHSSVHNTITAHPYTQNQQQLLRHNTNMRNNNNCVNVSNSSSTTSSIISSTSSTSSEEETGKEILIRRFANFDPDDSSELSNISLGDIPSLADDSSTEENRIRDQRRLVREKKRRDKQRRRRRKEITKLLKPIKYSLKTCIKCNGEFPPDAFNPQLKKSPKLGSYVVLRKKCNGCR